jgi:hypothetical protein
MNRRDFLKYLGLGTAAVVGAGEVDLDRILWVPNQKKIFIPEHPRIVHGLEAQRVYNAQQSAAMEILGVGPKQWAFVGRDVHTAAGRITLDAHENVVKRNDRLVGAQEAARLRLTMFNPNNRQPSHAAMNEMVSRVIAERTAAGWTDPVGPDPWHFPHVFEKCKIVILEGA